VQELPPPYHPWLPRAPGGDEYCEECGRSYLSRRQAENFMRHDIEGCILILRHR